MISEEMAARMYPATSTSTPVLSEGSSLGADQAVADRMYPTEARPAQREDIPTLVAELRASPERRMFDAEVMFRSALPDGTLDGSDFTIDTAEARRVAADLGAETADLSTLSSLAKEAQTADATTIEGWRAQSEQVVKANGYTAADLDYARALVGRDPRVVEYLERTGLGNHPVLVERFIKLARSAKASGRLK